MGSYKNVFGLPNKLGDISKFYYFFITLFFFLGNFRLRDKWAFLFLTPRNDQTLRTRLVSSFLPIEEKATENIKVLILFLNKVLHSIPYLGEDNAAMRPYFGGGGGRGMGGSGNMLRVVGRAVTRTGVGFQDPFPAATNAANSAAASSGAPTSPRTASGHAHNLSSRNQLSLSSASAAPFPPFSVPVSAACSAWSPFSSPQYDDYELVSADGSEDERNVYFDDFLLGTVPSIDEVHSAVSAIQQ